jgi:hypothetical protein
VAERCRQLGLLRIDPVTLVGIVRQGLGRTEQVGPETAAQMGRVLSLDNFEAVVPDRGERQELEAVLRNCRFRAADENWRSVGELHARGTGNADEDRRVAFAPPSAVLAPDYRTDALSFFRLARARAGFSPRAELLADWARRAGTSEGRRAVLCYLLKGETAPRLLEALRDNSPVWLATASALEDPELAVGLVPHDRMRLRAALFPETLKVVEPDAHFAVRSPPNVRRFLEAVFVWWAQEGPALAHEYGSKLYPEGFESSALREPYSPEGRIGWFTLLALASFSSMGRTRDEQHRSFIMAGLQTGWWKELALSASDDPAPWLRRLEKAADDYVDEQLFLQWHRRLFDLYILARWLEIYVHLFLSLPQRLQQIGGDLSLVRLVRPASDPDLSGSGLWAPAIDRTLGYGVCLVIRELVRFGVVDGSRLGPYAWQPTRRLRALLHWLGMDLPNDAMPDRAPLIWRFVSHHLGSSRACFDGAFDLPLQLLASRNRRDALDDIAQGVGLEPAELDAALEALETDLSDEAEA